MAIPSEFVQGSSSSHDHNYRRYDAFLSFRGADTRNKFTDHLYNALGDANITTFRDDDEIESGQNLKPELENAIKSSRAFIIVLSKDYATSTWCLDELVLILEQHFISGQIVIPIFYDVEPTHVRKQEASFGVAMTKHRQRMEAETNAEKRSQWVEKIDKWNKALTQVADLKGMDVKGRKETEFIEEIVSDIQRRLGVPLNNTLPLLVGMEDQIEFMNSWVTDASCSHTAEILTILGMGGIGKTSLAKFVFMSHFGTFEKRSFIEGIGRRCAEKFQGLLDVQKQLYADISKTSSTQVHDVSRYTSMIGNVLADKKVLLVLDDIDSLDQLNALLGNKGLHPGSKIIITTKDESLTTKCELFEQQVQPEHTKLSLKGLYVTAALELLCFHAFKLKNPKEGYEEVSDDIVKYCEGHPLALTVLGTSLRNQDVVYWKDCIKGLKIETHSHIRNALQVSFDSLPYADDKELFKDIACFFVGMDREVSEKILEACGKTPIRGITNLIERCLLSIGHGNELMMHQLLQEMGKAVVHQESPKHPEKRSRLWRHEESFKVLQRKNGTKHIEGLVLDMKMLEKEKVHGSLELKMDALSRMDNLKILHLNNVQLNGSWSCEKFPEELRWLCMQGFPLKSIPAELPMGNLVVLDMSYSSIESFGMGNSSNQQPLETQQKQLIGSLKILDLSFCEELHTLGGFLELPALESLIVRKCINLTAVCLLLEECVDLVLVDLSYCNKLEKLPTGIGKLKKVKTLLLDGCITRGSRIKGSKETIASSSTSVEAMPGQLNSSTIVLLSSLEKLSLANNNLSNESFPMDLGCPMLKYLCLDGNPIASMPNCVRSLCRLETLSMEDCERLISIEYPPRTLTLLRIVVNDNLIKRLLSSEDLTTILLSLQPTRSSLQRIAFDRDMSPLIIRVDPYSLQPWSFEIEGMVKIQPMESVEEKVLCSLRWTNLDFINKRRIRFYGVGREHDESQTQMYYEFGIFSTFYEGGDMPHWISHTSQGPSISFTIPSSPNKQQLRGLNFCYVKRHGSFRKKFPGELTSLPEQFFDKQFFDLPKNSQEDFKELLLSLTTEFFELPMIKISNMTKKRTWIYKHYVWKVNVGGEWLTFISHWMFGMNDMEPGDHITITVQDKIIKHCLCGVSLVYDDGNTEEKEDALRDYKSWNHIIGGDLSPFQLTTEEYFLHNEGFMRSGNKANFPRGHYKEMEFPFRAFSKRENLD